MAIDVLPQGLTPALVKKYNYNTFMYGEYPHKQFWVSKYGDAQYRDSLNTLFSNNPNAPLLFYVHFPFCPKQCFYCTCRTKLTNDYAKALRYLDYLFKEIDLLRQFFDQNKVSPNFVEIHLGGGSPTWIKNPDFDRLIQKIFTIVNRDKLQEFTIEIDPRQVDRERLMYYHSKGVNRISIGVQEFDEKVQKAVNRVQPEPLIAALMTPELRKLFHSYNFDILRGLPLQTRDSFSKTIDTIIKLAPDRITYLSMIYSPDFSKHQLLLDKYPLPSEFERVEYYHEGKMRFLKNGYVQVGPDHFAKENDAVAAALRAKKLYWTGLGYTPGRYKDIIGVGTSSGCTITPRYYFHNDYDLPDYEQNIDGGKFPVFRGFALDDDDVIRRTVIKNMRCYFTVDMKEISQKYSIDFKSYFKQELNRLQPFIDDGLVTVTNDLISMTELGKDFTSNACNIFDAFVHYKKR